MDWQRVRPVLEAAYQLLDEAEATDPEAVCRALGRPEEDESARRALTLLHQGGYVGGVTIENTPVPVTITATEKGLREVRAWPSDGASQQVEQLLIALDRRIEDPETSEPERGRLRRLRAAVGEIAPRLMAQVLVEYAERAGLAPPSGGN